MPSEFLQETFSSALEEKNKLLDTLQASLTTLENEHSSLKVHHGC